MMKEPPASLLLDTCVLLDNYLGSRPNFREARELVIKSLKRGTDLLYSVGAVKDVHYIIVQTLKRERRMLGEEIDAATALADDQMAWSCIANMREIATAVGMDASDVWLAEKYKRLHRDVEDNLVIAAAQRSHADVLVTDDLELIRHAPVVAMTPADALILFEISDA